jgi:hypothetical protein
MSEEIDRLTAEEMLVLAGLLRKLVRIDGRFTEDEHAAISRLAGTVSETSDAKPIGAKTLFARIDQASEKYPDDQALRSAALATTRPEAREIIHALLFDVAASGAIGKGEADLLEWLEEKWELDDAQTVEG